MKHVLLKFCGLLGLVSFLLYGGCTRSETHSQDSYRVRILLDDGSGKYSFQNVELKTVTDLAAMSGSVVNMKIGGQLLMKYQANSKDLYYSEGTTPSAQFIKEGNVLRPSDTLSMLMATAMYHFEKGREFFDTFGANEGIKFPLKVMINGRLVEEKNGNLSVLDKDNASFIGYLDLFSIFAARDAQMPAGMNGGVLMHEYGHAIFSHRLDKVAARLKQEGRLPDDDYVHLKLLQKNGFLEESSPSSGSDDMYSENEYTQGNLFVQRALDEGAADYFGYAYSKNVFFLNSSYPSMFKERNLSQQKIITQNTSQFKMRLKAMKFKSDPYLVGSVFAHILYVLSQEWGIEKTNRKVLEFMDKYSEQLILQHKVTFISISDAVKFVVGQEVLSLNTCQRILDADRGELVGSDFTCNAVNSGAR